MSVKFICMIYGMINPYRPFDRDQSWRHEVALPSTTQKPENVTVEWDKPLVRCNAFGNANPKEPALY